MYTYTVYNRYAYCALLYPTDPTVEYLSAYKNPKDLQDRSAICMLNPSIANGVHPKIVMLASRRPVDSNAGTSLTLTCSWPNTHSIQHYMILIFKIAMRTEGRVEY